MNLSLAKKIQIVIAFILIVVGLILVIHSLEQKKFQEERKPIEEFKSYCVSPYINIESNPLTNSNEYCNNKFNEIFGVRT